MIGEGLAPATQRSVQRQNPRAEALDVIWLHLLHNAERVLHGFRAGGFPNACGMSGGWFPVCPG